MEAYFFGDDERRLFGIYSPPQTAWPKPVGVVICPPLGQEYMRCHRGLQSMATAFARSGLHVLRFDYYGTGDSGGNSADVTFDGCRSDLEAAAQELQEVSGAQEIVLIGMRLGATLVYQAGARPELASQLLLWDPVIIGKHYLQDMLRISRQMTADFDRFPRPRRARRAREDKELVGHAYGATLLDELRTLDLNQDAGPAAPLHMVLSPSVRNKPAMKKWLAKREPAAVLAAEEGFWADTALVEVAYLPTSTIAAAVSSLTS